MILFILFVGAAGSLLVDWNFTLTDDGERLTASRGLLTRRVVTIDRERLRGADVHDTPLRRPLGLVSVTAVVAGLRGRTGGTTLAPVLGVSETDRLLRVVDPAAPDLGAPLLRASARCTEPPPSARGRAAGAGDPCGCGAPLAVGRRRSRRRWSCSPSCSDSTATASWATASTAGGSSCAAAACSAAGRSSMPPASSPTSCAAHRGNGARACARSSSISARAPVRAGRSTPARSRPPTLLAGLHPRLLEPLLQATE